MRKCGIIAGAESIREEQDTELAYHFSQEINGINTTIEEYIEGIKRVSKEEIMEIARKMTIDTIFFLRD